MMNTFIQTAEHDPRYFDVSEEMLIDYAEEIEDILYRAYGDGVVITVTEVAALPLAMGNADIELTIRPARKSVKWLEEPKWPDDSTFKRMLRRLRAWYSR